jgi:glycosyltransferase involved in cell wall biosynthesis
VKIALFLIRNVLACHYSLFGYKDTLERMGHEVLEVAFPSNQVQITGHVLQSMPTIEQLMECDVILSTYHEYVQPWLDKLYPFDRWKQLMSKVPVLARFDESMDRGDLLLPQRVPTLKAWATHWSFPAAQDAEKFGGEWLPYGADTTIFKPWLRNRDTSFAELNDKPDEVLGKKEYDLAFVGSLYQKRHDYLLKLANHIGKNVTFHVGNVLVQDLSGSTCPCHEQVRAQRQRETTELLAENYRQIKIFFCLPPMSRLLVEKIFDIMACDTMVMYPRLADAGFQKNLSIFEDEKHIVYYDEGFYANNGKQVRYYLEHQEDIERIARAGGELVREKYTLEKMLEAMLNQVRSAREANDKVRV